MSAKTIMANHIIPVKTLQAGPTWNWTDEHEGPSTTKTHSWESRHTRVRYKLSSRQRTDMKQTARLNIDWPKQRWLLNEPGCRFALSDVTDRAVCFIIEKEKQHLCLTCCRYRSKTQKGITDITVPTTRPASVQVHNLKAFGTKSTTWIDFWYSAWNPNQNLHREASFAQTTIVCLCPSPPHSSACEVKPGASDIITSVKQTAEGEPRPSALVNHGGVIQLEGGGGLVPFFFFNAKSNGVPGERFPFELPCNLPCDCLTCYQGAR